MNIKHTNYVFVLFVARQMCICIEVENMTSFTVFFINYFSNTLE